MPRHAPLALPVGSVRALLAVALVGTCCYVSTTRGQIPGDLAALAGTVLAFYYRSRGEESPGTPMKEASHAD